MKTIRFVLFDSIVKLWYNHIRYKLYEQKNDGKKCEKREKRENKCILYFKLTWKQVGKVGTEANRP